MNLSHHQFFIQSLKLASLLRASICQWQRLTRTLPFSKGSACDSWIQSCLKQLPRPGSLPLSSSYIFTPLCGMCLWLSWVSVWDKQVLTAVCWLAALCHHTVAVLHWSEGPWNMLRSTSFDGLLLKLTCYFWSEWNFLSPSQRERGRHDILLTMVIY